MKRQAGEAALSESDFKELQVGEIFRAMYPGNGSRFDKPRQDLCDKMLLLSDKIAFALEEQAGVLGVAASAVPSVEGAGRLGPHL